VEVKKELGLLLLPNLRWKMCNEKEKGRLKEQAQWHIKTLNRVKLSGILQLIPLLDL
jgi:hypothetical protein